MTRSKRLRILGEIYAAIPSPHCKGLCVAHCTIIPILPIERDQIEATIGRPLAVGAMDNAPAVTIGEIGKPCEFLVVGRCAVYDVRPIICRVYGAADGLRCPHGCTPAIELTDDEAHSLFDRVADL